ncbi:autotransporter outer membrane beta-barrel domain-containing protein [Pasteurellaceae bacterium 22721_9_1]
MNKIFKSKWCVATQTYVACSELAKRAGKVSAGAVLLTASVISSVSAAPSNPESITTDTTLVGGVRDLSVNGGSAISIGNAATATLNDPLTLNLQTGNESEPRGFDITNGNLIANGKVSINYQPVGTNLHNRPKGIIVRSKSDTQIKDLLVNAVLASETEAYSVPADSNAGYGVAVGYNYAGGSSADKSLLTVENAEINVTNTPNTKYSRRTVGSGWVSATAIFGHQLSGLKIYRTDGAIPEFTSNGKVNINVTDSSVAKAGDYLVGLYISGHGSKATFNGDTEIKVSANGINSAGIKIGKPFDGGTVVGEKGSSVIANGKLVVDTTETKDSAAIRLFGNSSQLKVTGEKTEEQSLIHSGNSAIVFDTQDYQLQAETILGEIKASRNENGIDQSVILNNTKLQTNSENASLVKVKAEQVRDESFGYASKFSSQLNSGSFNVQNATFTLTGDKSLATAADKGWLIEVQGQKDNSSSLTANIEKKAKVVGLVHKELSSSLIMNVDDATWELKKKGDNISTANSVNLNNGGVLDASKMSSLTQAELDDSVAAAQDALNKANNMERAWYESVEKFNVRKQKTIETATANLVAAQDLAAKGPLNRAEYTVRLTSDGTNTDGILKNGGVITLANDRYNDVLTLEGNYAGAAGATLKVNTEWNSPGGENGENSKSDLFEIKGAASGRTNVVTVKADGSAENVIDGSIGSIAADLHKNSEVVVRVHDLSAGNNHAFEGTAQTTGAGELQLAERTVEKDGKMVREYYWTITAVNPIPPEPEPEPQPDAKPEPKPEPEPTPKPGMKPEPKPEPKPQPKPTPIYAQSVSGYVQMPRVNLEQGYASIATLHTRRGENQTLAWDDCSRCGSDVKGQSWARVFGSHLEADGKVRLNFDTNLFGVQLGHDFAVQRTAENGHRLTGVYATYTQAKTNFFDDERRVNAKLVDDKFTGSGKSKSWSFGLTHTRYAANGSYVDLVGQVSFINNKYTSRNNVSAKNKGMSYLLSAEVGRPYALGERGKTEGGWLIEPQAQLIAQYLDLKRFTDEQGKKVDQGDTFGLRGRAGVRLAYNAPTEDNRTKTFYVTANILHDFTNMKSVQIGQDKLREKYAKTWWDAGVGVQYPVAQKAYVYLDAHYEGSFSKHQRRDGYRGSLGIKYNW